MDLSSHIIEFLPWPGLQYNTRYWAKAKRGVTPSSRYYQGQQVRPISLFQHHHRSPPSYGLCPAYGPLPQVDLRVIPRPISWRKCPASVPHPEGETCLGLSAGIHAHQ
ncbi:hypothetical protein Agabi119p4_2857 [Agaricus bisporus var. burnettii]|uniref:Uncharacterized protein n=1 Tax=Agaricus bisporus var. burnettii TaxID=192524 RepID=A0A8H7F5Y7_AGABI|nr:hypothetical protein Agabi119p4_2857 [Agaricus bisporus var. burnettii]